MVTAEYCISRAAEALQLANKTIYLEGKAIALALANEWLDLAIRLERRPTRPTPPKRA
jgi:hypothetical protein